MHQVPVALYKLAKNKKVKVVENITESFNLDSVLAQLKNYENSTATSENDVVTYGVEDNKGNLMKVTILDTQADDFESYISAYLSELKNFENNGVDLDDISLAELLYKLRDLFDIRDVEFPNIPEDVVYNADEASDSVEDVQQTEMGDEDEFGGDELGGDEFGGDELGGDEFGGDEFGDEDEFGGDEFGGDELGGDEFGDDESVEDFDDFEDESTTASLLSNIIDMLKAQAEQEKAKFEMEAEKARAEQAEYSARAAEATLANREEVIAMQAEKDSQKQAEKDAKKQADLATYRYKKSRGMLDNPDAKFEGFSPDSLLMSSLLAEEDIITDPSMVRRAHMIEVRNLLTAIQNAENDDEKRALQKELMLLQRKLPLDKMTAKAREERRQARAEQTEKEAGEQNADPRQDRNQNQQQQQQQSQQQNGVVRETITPEEYELLEEAAKRQFKRYGNKFVRKFRCYGGPKDGRMVSKAADCGVKKDPFKVRQGKRSARLKKGQRVRKTMMTKRKAPSKRVTRMNDILRGEKTTKTGD
jgi:hypothetical protein